VRGGPGTKPSSLGLFGRRERESKSTPQSGILPPFTRILFFHETASQRCPIVNRSATTGMETGNTELRQARTGTGDMFYRDLRHALPGFETCFTGNRDIKSPATARKDWRIPEYKLLTMFFNLKQQQGVLLF